MHRIRLKVMAPRFWALAALLAVIGAAGPAAAANDDDAIERRGEPVTLENAAGFELRFTPAGLVSITHGERTFAEGEWHLMNKALGAIERQRISRADNGAVRVHHEHAHGTVDYTYTIDGEDVTVEAYVTNRSPDATLRIAEFGKLMFRFKGEHDEDQLTPHSKYGLLPDPRRRSDLAYLHPGWGCRIGGSYGADQTLGVGATPVYDGLTRTLLEWNGKWGGDQRQLRYHSEKTLPPNASRTFTFRLRLSTNTDWKHLLSPYRAQLRALTGGQQYEADHRGVMMTQVAAGAHRTPSNPYGYSWHNRIHRESHMRERAKEMAARMSAANMQGELIWANTGYAERGCMFRTDFDVMPPAVDANWDILDRIYKKHGLAHGVCARSRQITYRVHWTGDNFMLRDTSDPAHMAVLWQRYQNMLDHGSTMFYLDAMGHRGLGDVRLVRMLRERLGPEAGLYVEHPTDMVMAYTGTWMMAMSPKKKDRQGFNIYWGLMDEWRIFQFLFEDPVALANPRRVGKNELAKFYRWCFENGITPLPHQLKIEPEAFRKLQAEYVTEDGQWKD